MKQLLILSVIIVVITVLPCNASAPVYGTGKLDWSWDHVRRAIYLSQTTELTPAEFDYLAANYELITLALGYASEDYGNYDAAIANSAREIKQRNPKAVVLYYLNASRVIGYYPANAEFKANPDWALDPSEVVLTNRNTPEVNLANPDAVEWMVRRVKSALEIPNVDGIWLDAMTKGFWPANEARLRRLYPPNRFEDGLFAMLEGMEAACEARDALFIGNILQHLNFNKPEKMRSYLSGIFVEGHPYFLDKGDEPDVIRLKQVINRMHKAGKEGQVMWTFLGGKSVLSRLDEKQTLTFLQDHVEKRLAVFLLTAERYSYLDYKEDFKGHKLWMFQLPEFSRPLGRPLGDMRVEGSVYTREFEHCSVTVNLEDMTKTGIDWHSESECVRSELE